MFKIFIDCARMSMRYFFAQIYRLSFNYNEIKIDSYLK